MAETFATERYREKLFANLSVRQSLIVLALLAPFVYMAFRGYPKPLVFAYLMFFLASYGGISYFGLDERVERILYHRARPKRLEYGTKQMGDFFNIKKIRGNTVLTGDGRLLCVLKVFPKDLGGLSQTDIEKTMAGYSRMLSSLASSIQIIMASSEVDIRGYLDQVGERVLRSADERRIKYFNHVRDFTENIIKSKTVSDRAYYIIVSECDGERLNATAAQITDCLRCCQSRCVRLCESQLSGFYSSFLKPKIYDFDYNILDISFSKNQGRYAGLEQSMGVKYSDDGLEKRVWAEQDVCELIAPEEIVFEKDHVIAGMYHRIIYARRFPSVVEPGWLTRLLRFDEDIDVCFHIHPLSKGFCLEYLQNEAKKLETDVTAKQMQGLLVPQRDKTSLLKVRRLLELVAADREKCFELSFYVDVKAHSLKDLEASSDKVRKVLESIGVSAQVARYEMWEALKSVSPLACDGLGPRCSKVFPSTALRDSYPFILSSVGGQSPEMSLIGYNQLNSTPILFDFFKHPNPHALVLGSSGSGKSFFVKKLAMNLSLQDCVIAVVDPHGEYRPVVESLGGKVVRFSNGSKNRLNLFDPKIDCLEGRMGSVKSLLCLAAKTCCDSNVDGFLQKVIDITYRKSLIFSDDPKTHSKKPPTFVDMHAVLNHLAQDHKADEKTRGLAASFASHISCFVGGSLGFLGRQTSVDVRDCRVFSFDLSNVVFKSPFEKTLALFAVFDFIQALMGGLDEDVRKYVVVDEAWTIFENTVDYLGPIARSGRKNNLSLIMVSQDAEDLLGVGSDGVARGHAILNNTSTKVLLSQQRQQSRLCEKSFGLTASQAKFLASAGVGDALLITPSARTPMFVASTEYERCLFSTTPGKGKKTCPN